MDINQLLSPDQSGSSASPSTSPSKPRRRPPPGKRTTSTLSQEVSRSPDNVVPQHASPAPVPTAPAAPARNAYYQGHNLPSIAESTTAAQRNVTSNPTTPHSSFAPDLRRPSASQRSLSTPQMETLADLASMQQRNQPPRANSSSNIRRVDSIDVRKLSPPTPTAPPVMRTHSGQSLADLTMAEAPAQTPPPRTFRSDAFTEEESTAITDLLNHLSENSYAYDVHVQLIGMLHKGFLAHVYPSAGENVQPEQDPKSFGLASELRQAREAMDSRFSVGEDIWFDWLSDEALIAKTTEERIAVTEQFQKALADEPSSVKLWNLYADWVQACHASCNNLEGSKQAGWTEEDKEMCRELFTRQMLVDVLEQGATATQWRLDESHLVWNRFVKIFQDDVAAAPSSAGVESLRTLFVQRLQTPHMAWNDTSQTFWPIVNKYEGNNWEAVMAQVNEMAEPARKQTSLREEHEHTLQRAIESRDPSATFEEFGRYLKWETKIRRQNTPFEKELRCGLYERALLRFPTHTEWWLEYVDYIIGTNPPTSVIPLLERATRHCPWSGDLWAMRILRADVEGFSREDIEAIKHRATNAGLLDVGGLEELVKMLQQWCSYLRRHAFRRESVEDDIDTAEVGIMMAIEDIQQAGKKIYGQDFKGDPLYRLETIQTKFYTEARRLNDARDIYKRLSKTQGHSSDFWLRYYYYEFCLWGIERMTEPKRIETRENGPHLATAVVQEALAQKNLDSPEKVLELYSYHFQQHESGERLQLALVEARQYAKRLAYRRAKEAEAATEAAAPQTTAAAALTTDTVSVLTGDKRKATEALLNGDSKKAKYNDMEVLSNEIAEDSASANAQIKRDRENNTITLRNLPNDVQELDIEKFFRDVGRPKSIDILRDKAGATSTAKVEFESKEDILSAKTRNGKELNGNAVTILSGTQSTLYVTNYPAEHDEAAIRALFESYGEIVSIRFPSLKYNNRRRFCYVSFLTEDMAKAAEEAMDGKKLDGLHTLVAKISNPDAAKQRSGAQAEGRELFVKNLDVQAGEGDVRTHFEQYGTVLSMNLLKLVNGRRTGSGFIVFSSPEEANSALGANNKPFKDRILHVEISTPKGGAAPADKAKKEDVIIKGATSMSPEPTTNGRRGSEASQHDSESAKTAKERKVAIFNLPDTVNDARIKTAMEAYGPITKIQLRRQDNGAIVEFADLKVAFNVRQGVDCSALGSAVTTGDVADLLTKVKKRQATQSNTSGGLNLAPSTIARPGQARGGRRGGLGTKRGGLGFVPGKSAEGGGGAGAKSNADFRSMLEQSREKKGKEGEDEQMGEA